MPWDSMHDFEFFDYTCGHNKHWCPNINQTFKQGLTDLNYVDVAFIVVSLVDADPPNGWCQYGSNNMWLN